jgi:hypothetical protein
LPLFGVFEFTLKATSESGPVHDSVRMADSTRDDALIAQTPRPSRDPARSSQRSSALKIPE